MDKFEININKYTRICENHFENEFICKKTKNKCLRWDAVPTLFKQQTEAKERRPSPKDRNDTFPSIDDDSSFNETSDHGYVQGKVLFLESAVENLKLENVQLKAEVIQQQSEMTNLQQQLLFYKSKVYSYENLRRDDTLFKKETGC